MNCITELVVKIVINEFGTAASNIDPFAHQVRINFVDKIIGVQIKMAMMGDHSCVLEGLTSTNRLVSAAAIRNPKVTEADVAKVAKGKSLPEDVVRFICNNKDWTKSYHVRLSLLHNPKTPPSCTQKWLPLLRSADCKSLSKSKQVPTHVSTNARRIMQTKMRG